MVKSKTAAIFFLGIYIGSHVSEFVKAKELEHPVIFKERLLAEKVAELILGQLYGVAAIEDQKPLILESKGNSWEIRGTFHSGTPANSSQVNISAGGVAHITIEKSNGCITELFHSM